MEKYIATLKELENFANEFLSEHPLGGVFGLSGDLGAGKTTFVRACIGILCAKSGVAALRVTSPTYVLHQRYPKLSSPIEHFDLYRLDKITQMALTDLGFFDAVDFARENKGFVFIEWPERAEKMSSLLLDKHLIFTVADQGRVVKTNSSFQVV